MNKILKYLVVTVSISFLSLLPVNLFAHGGRGGGHGGGGHRSGGHGGWHGHHGWHGGGWHGHGWHGHNHYWHRPYYVYGGYYPGYYGGWDGGAPAYYYNYTTPSPVYYNYNYNYPAYYESNTIPYSTSPDDSALSYPTGFSEG